MEKENNGALSGILVLDLSRLLPGPYASMILADHGARVISIEDRRFAGEALKDNTVNRNKQHMTLNLKTPAGREIFYKLARSADVILEGFRPGVTERLGVDYDSLSEINPRIVYCSITGYGQTGPNRAIAGHDVNYLSIAGVLDLIGEPDRPPSIPGIQIADMAGGGMNAVIGILLALYNREKTGKGQYIDVSMTDGSLSLMSLVLNLQQFTGQPVRRGNAFLSQRYACYNTYETADGRHLSVGAVENRFWKPLCDYFGVPEYIPLQYDDSQRREIIAFFRKAFKAKTLAQWEIALKDVDACWAPVRQLPEVLADPLFAGREMVVGIDRPDGRHLTALGVPVKLNKTPGAVRTPPPDFGDSTSDVLLEFGYTAAEIRLFSEQGIV